MATKADNCITSSAFVNTFYPELTGIVTTLDGMAAVGRTSYTITLETDTHWHAVKAKLELDLSGLGYSVTGTGKILTIVICP